MIPTSDVPSYRNRKEFISQNVFDACNFDLEFMYVLSGWEGSAHDSKILSNALTRHGSRLTIPEGMYLSCSKQFRDLHNFFFIYKLNSKEILSGRLWICKSSKVFSSIQTYSLSFTRI